VERLKQDVLMNSSRKNIRTSFNYRIYTNTIKQAYDAILKTGKQAEYEETRFDDRVEVKIVIPLEES
jgi:ParB family chromosome partitioning protein